MLLNEDEEIDLGIVKKRSLTGVVSLISRSFFIHVISLVSTLLLTIFLDPKIFGIFFLVSAFINFFSYFSDIGLAAALIQKKGQITDEDLKTTFTVQQFLVLALLVLIIGLTPLIRRFYGLSQPASYLVYALGISLFLSSLKTIPSVLLERSLKFDLLVITQIAETLVFNILAVTLAWKGFGITSFTIAVLARGAIGLILIYLLSPWQIGLAFSQESLSHLLKFGLPYQANTIIAVLKDDLMTVYLGKVIGTTGLGYLGWGKKWAEQPLRFFMDNVLKVIFPAYARIQDDKKSLAQAVEKSIFFLTFLTFPFLIGLSVMAKDLVSLIPRYQKWMPALIPLYLYCFNSAMAVVSTVTTNLFNAIGKIKTTFKLMIMWLVLTWVTMPFLGIKYGYIGVAWATALIACSSIVPVILARREIKFSLTASVFKPFLTSALMGAVIFILKSKVTPTPLGIFLVVILGGISYLFFSYLLFGRVLFQDLKKILIHFKKGKN